MPSFTRVACTPQLELQKLDNSINKCQIIVVSPTRELAVQIFNVAKSLSTYLDVNLHLLQVIYFSLFRFYRCHSDCDLCGWYSGFDYFWSNAY